MNKEVLYEGPDISEHQRTVDIKRIRNAGCKGIGLRVGYGKNNVDQKFTTNALACYNLRVSVMLYWFSYAYNVDMAAAEAEYAMAQATKYWMKCPMAYDFEYDSVNYARKNGVIVTRELATDMAIAFLQRIRNAGYIPVIYTNRDYLQNYFDMERITAALGMVYVWYARYISSLPTGEADIPDIWQYTSTGRIQGVNGNVDMNRFYTDFSENTVLASRKEKPNLNIKAFQSAANADGYLDANGNPLVEDGLDGPKTQYVRRQIVLQAKKSGRKYVAGSTGAVVGWWQQKCNEILGHSQAVDRRYGPATRAATMDVQRKFGLKVDGVAGYNSIQSAFYN